MTFDKVIIKKSSKPEKKLMAIFTDDKNNKKKTIHFGQAGSPDYTLTKDKKQRARYIARHKARENWKVPDTAGSLSRHILWGAFTSKDKNISAFKRKFNLK